MDSGTRWEADGHMDSEGRREVQKTFVSPHLLPKLFHVNFLPSGKLHTQRLFGVYISLN